MPTKFRLNWSAVVFAAGLMFSALLMGQATGTISGFVTDPTGSPVPDAKVAATQVEQQIARVARTNGEGYYTFNAMPPGDYTLTAEKAGFQRLARSGATLTVNQNLRVDFSVQLGQISQQVTITGEVALVDTEGETAIDVFYLTRNGSKLDKDEQRVLRWALVQAIEENAR